MHHQIACLWDIKERHSWLCEEWGIMEGGVESRFLETAKAKSHHKECFDEIFLAACKTQAKKKHVTLKSHCLGLLLL